MSISKKDIEEISNKLNKRDAYENRKLEIMTKCQKELDAIDKNIKLLDIDIVTERAYNTAMYAIENFDRCKDMSVVEAYEYVDYLFKKQEEIENEQ